MLVPQKTRYALRAIFELALRRGDGPIKIAQVAEAQAIPGRFLESILNQLKRGGFVEARRGSEGGYYLAWPPEQLTVGQIMRFMQGPLRPVDCLMGDPREPCPFQGECVFLPTWQEAEDAVFQVYHNTTFQDLLDRETARRAAQPLDYEI